jgi:tetratricopeptide (TPR) repeat protein
MSRSTSSRFLRRYVVRTSSLRRAPVLLLVVGWLAGCGDAPDPPGDQEGQVGEPSEMTAGDWNPAHRAGDPRSEPQALSFFGEELYAMEDTAGIVAAADSALAQDPDDVERLIHSARERRHVWQYRQAMELYERAAELAPEDWRPPRFKGHRHISLREFGEAVRELEAARELAPLNWDVAYHLGLAYFLDGRFDQAADEYLRCLGLADSEEARAIHDEDFRSCSANNTDPESLVAMTEWTVRALQRAGRETEAQEILAALPDDLEVEANIAYLHNLDMARGLRTPEELLNPGDDAPYRLETVGFGVANHLLARGDTAAAREILEQLMDDPWWPGFGRIAAETELARLDGVLNSP